MAKTLNSRIPEGPVAEKWTNYKAHQRLVNPKNKLKLDVIVVGTGLAGASAAASLGEMGFNVLNFCIQDSPRRAHSIAAQGGINAAKNYQNDGASVATIVPVKPTSIVWPRCQTISLISVWLRVCLLHASTAACSPTARSVVPRCRVRSMPKDRQVSSFCLVPILR